MEIIYKKVSELKPYENNPRINEGAVNAVANSIEEFGFKVPIIIGVNNEIICGHTRLKAAQKLNLREVPCILADDLDEEQIRAFRIADNSVSEKSEWDFTKLKKELENITDIDMDKFDIDISIVNLDISKVKKKKEKNKTHICPYCGGSFEEN